MHRAYRQSTRLLATAICALGVVLIITTLIRGGGALALGLVVGVLFVALGAGRLYLAGGR